MTVGGGTEGPARFWRDDEGQGMVEYSLVIMTIAIVIIAVMIFIRGELGNEFSNIGNTLT